MRKTETLVGGILLVLALIAGGSGLISWRSYHNLLAAQARNTRIEELTGEIRYLDEVLTMSARMGAATGDPAWEQRYLDFEPQLSAAIEETKRLVPEAFAIGGAQQTEAANDALVQMEHQSFELSRDNRGPEALALLASDAYTQQKTIYSQGNDQIRAFLLNSSASTLASANRMWLISIIPGAAAILAALLLGVALNLNLSKRRATQTALTKLNAELETRVLERTKQLIVHQEALRQSEARFRSLIQNSSSIVTVVDMKGVIRYQSATVETLLGYGQNDLISTAFVDLVHPEDYNRAADLIARSSSDPVAKHSIDCRLRMSNGAWMLSEVIAQNLVEDPNIQGIVLTASDIGQRKALEEKLIRQALHDPLTGLPNRLLFKERLEHAVVQRSKPGVCHAVFFLDVDDFKIVNDSMGHLAGDEFLIKVAQRLNANARVGDTVSRFGGDEFALLLENITKIDATKSAKRILESMKDPFLIGDRAVQASLSIGIVYGEGESINVIDLLRDADTAMYIAKARGKGRFEVFLPTMHEVAVGRMDIESEMRVGLDEGQFAVFYQPVISFASKEIAGFEALLRWNHPQRGLLLPASFLEIAEETGLILTLGQYVLTQACNQAAEWQRQHPTNPPLTMAVNLSAVELAQPLLLERVSAALVESGLPAESLILEFTETILLPRTAALLKELVGLRSLGVKLAIDDFGTGYASLTYLHEFPVDIVKIDKSFVDGITEGPSGAAFSDAIVTLARDLGLSTMAEGVESSDQVERLNELGCNYWQGFLFSEALSKADIERLLVNTQAGLNEQHAA